MRLYQRTWHGIDLTSLPAAATAVDRPASVELYAQFYQALAAGRGRIEPHWLENKRRLGEAIGQDAIKPWQHRRGRSPRILALGAGKAPVERVWHEQGHAVTFHDCQEDSLAETRREFPRAEFLIGDIFQMQPAARYDVITMITIDYVMNRREFADFLARATRWLEADGQIVLYCASTLSFRQLAVETVRRALGYYRRNRHVFWGYWRTPGEFFSAAASAGLRVSEVFSLDQARLKSKPAPLRRWPSLRDAHLVLTLELNR